jgi:hypothetical protein
VSEYPRFGHTRDGTPVHARAIDHLPNGTAVNRVNKWLAIKITSGVGTMWCAYAFMVLSLISLPSVIGSGNVVTMVQWVAQTFLQLVLLSVIVVGQNIQSQASDARAAKTFEDVEKIIDELNLETQGGLRDLYEKLHAELTQVAPGPGLRAEDERMTAVRPREPA